MPDERNQHSEPLPSEREQALILARNVRRGGIGMSWRYVDVPLLARELLNLVEQLESTRKAMTLLDSNPAFTPDARERTAKVPEKTTTHSIDWWAELEDAISLLEYRGGRWRIRGQVISRLRDAHVAIHEQLERLKEQLEAYERFEDNVRDVMDFMPHDGHYEALNAALGGIRASNPANEPRGEFCPRCEHPWSWHGPKDTGCVVEVGDRSGDLCGCAASVPASSPRFDTSLAPILPSDLAQKGRHTDA